MGVGGLSKTHALRQRADNPARTESATFGSRRRPAAGRGGALPSKGRAIACGRLLMENVGLFTFRKQHIPLPRSFPTCGPSVTGLPARVWPAQGQRGRAGSAGHAGRQGPCRGGRSGGDATASHVTLAPRQGLRHTPAPCPASTAGAAGPRQRRGPDLGAAWPAPP